MYLEEEIKNGVTVGKFGKNPIDGSHSSPFMTQIKINPEKKMITMDLI